MELSETAYFVLGGVVVLLPAFFVLGRIRRRRTLPLQCVRDTEDDFVVIAQVARYTRTALAEATAAHHERIHKDAAYAIRLAGLPIYCEELLRQCIDLPGDVSDMDAATLTGRRYFAVKLRYMNRLYGENEARPDIVANVLILLFHERNLLRSAPVARAHREAIGADLRTLFGEAKTTQIISIFDSICAHLAIARISPLDWFDHTPTPT
jgi:hypothetical protein